MSAEQITSAALALSAAERATLAAVLWESLGDDPDPAEASEALDLADLRARGIESGMPTLSHDEVFAVARQALRCP